MRPIFASALLVSALLTTLPGQAQTPDTASMASPALVAHLLSQLEAREKPSTSLLGLGSTKLAPTASPRSACSVYCAAIQPPSDSPTSTNSPTCFSRRNSPRKSTQVWMP